MKTDIIQRAHEALTGLLAHAPAAEAAALHKALAALTEKPSGDLMMPGWRNGPGRNGGPGGCDPDKTGLER